MKYLKYMVFLVDTSFCHISTQKRVKDNKDIQCKPKFRKFSLWQTKVNKKLFCGEFPIADALPTHNFFQG